MNAKQLCVFIVSMILVLLSELFPPWRYEYLDIVGHTLDCPAGYSFVTRPPAVKSYKEMLDLCIMDSELPRLEQIIVHKNREALNWQRNIILLLSVGLLLLLTTHKAVIKSVIGWALFSLGVIILLLYTLIQLVI